MLSLPPRHDLFRFEFPKDFISDEIAASIKVTLGAVNGPLREPIDYLNESIVGVNIPGISDLMTQQQTTWFSSQPYAVKPSNPLDKITKEFKVTFRLNNGLYNFFMMFNALLAKHHTEPRPFRDDYLELCLLNAGGERTLNVRFYNCVIKGVDKLSLSYNKIERQVESFEVTFAFANIDIEFCTQLVE